MIKKAKLIFTMVLAAGLASTYLEGCKKDEPLSALTLVSLKTDAGVALDGVTSAAAIPLGSSVVATFSKPIDPASATSTSIVIMANGSAVATTVTTVDAVVTIKPNAILATGSNHTVSLKATLKATDGVAATAGDFTFKTFGPSTVVAPQEASLLSFFSFNGNLNDTKGTHTPASADVKDITFVTDRFGFAGFAGSFNGTTSIAEIPNGDGYMIGPDFSISFWIKADGTKEGHFVLGLGAWKGFQFEIAGGPWTALDKGVKIATQYDLGNNLTDAEDTWWNGNPNGWQGSTFAKDVTASGGIASSFKDKWVHVVCTYNKATRVGTMYINGDKTRSWDFNLWPNGELKKTALGVKFAGNLTGGGNKLALGFIQASGNRIITDTWADPSDPANNHFKGLMDDVRIWKATLTATEITALYNAEKP
jgi:hypothetical protein